MKKIIVLLMTLAGVTAAQADGYDYLTFETTDGVKASVAVSSPQLTISGTTLTAGTKSFTLSNLVKMYFTTSDESTETGVETIQSSQCAIDEATDIYDLQGRRLNGKPKQKGIYIREGRKVIQ